MDQDIKLTYTVIAVLIVLLGGFAYFLQGNMSLPQVQVDKQATSTEGLKKKSLPIIKTTEDKQSNSTTTAMQLPEKITSAIITTNKGVIEITFSTKAPETVKNFAKLALENFYNGTRFHRVIRDFMIQGGDPLSKDLAQKDRWGTGGPGYTFGDEISQDDVFSQGTLAMANSGPNTNGSQFFIVTAVAGTPWLTGKHTVFGHVTSGLDVVLRIGDMQTDGTDKPIQDVIVEKIEIK
ncbi:MAG: peptidylprolyl isomerase [Candidatus Paceibacterota bacterium]